MLDSAEVPECFALIAVLSGPVSGSFVSVIKMMQLKRGSLLCPTGLAA